MMSKEQSGVLKVWEATIRKTHAAKKRATNTILGTITVTPSASTNTNTSTNEEASDPEPPNGGGGGSSGEPFFAEKILPNGDYYTGQWYDSFPNGQGKYLWTDGCMYVGEWYRGKSMGRGWFSWPSGAIYEGDFKSGFMDGHGIYTGPYGDTYKGQWVMNLKHGHGVKQYPNGDWYDGEWRRGSQEGQGKYQWRNGNYYLGEWKEGDICGVGCFIWKNGDMFDGAWENGFPKGSGTYKRADGGFYVGNWSKDPDEQNGTYYPTPECPQEWDPQELYITALADCEVYPDEKVTIFPSQKKIAMSKQTKGADRPRRLSVDGKIGVSNQLDKAFDRMNVWGSDGEGDLLGLNYDADNPKFNMSLPLRVPKLGTRLGDTISKGHKNYELMVSLQLGIKYTVTRHPPVASLDLKASSFDPKEKIWTRFPPEGTKPTPQHQLGEFKWKDYCPLVFRTLRKLFKIDPEEYMQSICGNENALRELSSPGKSGSLFYFSNDDRYMIKTMKKSEAKVIIRMLQAYFNHVKSFENTLLVRYFGLHCIKSTGPVQRKVRFIVMGNLFCSRYPIHRKFDLKGSSLGRITDKPDSEIDSNTILKDLDLNFIFKLNKSWFEEFSRQVDRDSEFLEQERIMDYSLLVGLHFNDVSPSGELIPCGARISCDGVSDSDSALRLSRSDGDSTKSPNVVGLGNNTPARVERTLRKHEFAFQLVGEPTGECYEVIMFFGIIDILQDYDISKKLEHAYKSIQYDATSISAVDPRLYSKRFRDFVFKAFAEDHDV